MRNRLTPEQLFICKHEVVGMDYLLFEKYVESLYVVVGDYIRLRDYREKMQPFEVISKQEAIKQRYNKYYTGESCKRGHDSFRYVKSGSCLYCNIR